MVYFLLSILFLSIGHTKYPPSLTYLIIKAIMAYHMLTIDKIFGWIFSCICLFTLRTSLLCYHIFNSYYYNYNYLYKPQNKNTDNYSCNK